MPYGLETSSSSSELHRGRWKYEEIIILGEGRAVVKLLDGLASIPEAHGFIISSMQDNEPFSLAVAKGRSSAPAVNYILRKVSAISLAADIKANLPWVDSSHQAADKSSRRR